MEFIANSSLYLARGAAGGSRIATSTVEPVGSSLDGGRINATSARKTAVSRPIDAEPRGVGKCLRTKKPLLSFNVEA